MTRPARRAVLFVDARTERLQRAATLARMRVVVAPVMTSEAPFNPEPVSTQGFVGPLGGCETKTNPFTETVGGWRYQHWMERVQREGSSGI